MPYIIETKTPAKEHILGKQWHHASYHAVATLDEARAYMRPILDRSYPHGPVGNAAALRDLEGFSPILLEDGTVIEVERVDNHALLMGLPADKRLWPRIARAEGESGEGETKYGMRLLAAYNAVQ